MALYFLYRYWDQEELDSNLALVESKLNIILLVLAKYYNQQIDDG